MDSIDSAVQLIISATYDKARSETELNALTADIAKAASKASQIAAKEQHKFQTELKNNINKSYASFSRLHKEMLQSPRNLKEYNHQLKLLEQSLKRIKGLEKYSRGGGLITPEVNKNMQKGVILFERMNRIYQKSIYNQIKWEKRSQLSSHWISLGKNTQWLGRQLTVGLTAPLILFGRTAVQQFQHTNKQFTRMRKILDSINDTEFTGLKKEIRGIADSFGVVTEATAAVAADLAAAGFSADKNDKGAKIKIWDIAGMTGDAEKDIKKFKETTTTQLGAATNEIERIATLGDVDLSVAQDFFRSMRASFVAPKISDFAAQMAEMGSIMNTFNAIENQTNVQLKELAESFPLVAQSAANFGFEAEETGALLTGMFERIPQANANANALKFILQRIVNPTAKATKAFDKAIGKDFLMNTNRAYKGLDRLLVIFDAIRKVQDPILQRQLLSEISQNRQVDKMLSLYNSLEKVHALGNKTYTQITRAVKDLADGLNAGKKFDDAFKSAAVVKDNTGKIARNMNDAEKALVLAEITSAKMKKNLSDAADKEIVIRLGTPEMKVAFFTKRLKDSLYDVGELLIPKLIRGLDMVTKLLNKINGLSDGFKNIIVWAGIGAMAMGPLILVIGQLGTAFSVILKAVAWGGDKFGKWLSPIKKLDSSLLELTAVVENLNGSIMTAGGSFYAVKDSAAGALSAVQAEVGATTAEIQAMNVALAETALTGTAHGKFKAVGDIPESTLPTQAENIRERMGYASNAVATPGSSKGLTRPKWLQHSDSSTTFANRSAEKAAKDVAGTVEKVGKKAKESVKPLKQLGAEINGLTAAATAMGISPGVIGSAVLTSAKPTIGALGDINPISIDDLLSAGFTEAQIAEQIGSPIEHYIKSNKGSISIAGLIDAGFSKKGIARAIYGSDSPEFMKKLEARIISTNKNLANVGRRHLPALIDEFTTGMGGARQPGGGRVRGFHPRMRKAKNIDASVIQRLWDAVEGVTRDADGYIEEVATEYEQTRSKIRKPKMESFSSGPGSKYIWRSRSAYEDPSIGARPFSGKIYSTGSTVPTGPNIRLFDVLMRKLKGGAATPAPSTARSVVAAATSPYNFDILSGSKKVEELNGEFKKLFNPFSSYSTAMDALGGKIKRFFAGGEMTSASGERQSVKNLKGRVKDRFEAVRSYVTGRRKVVSRATGNVLDLPTQEGGIFTRARRAISKRKSSFLNKFTQERGFFKPDNLKAMREAAAPTRTLFGAAKQAGPKGMLGGFARMFTGGNGIGGLLKGGLFKGLFKMGTSPFKVIIMGLKTALPLLMQFGPQILKVLGSFGKFTAIGAIIGGVIVFIMQLIKHWKEVRSKLQPGIDAIQKGFKAVSDAVGKVVGIFTGALSNALGGSKSEGEEQMTTWEKVGQVLSTMGEIIGGALGMVAKVINWLSPLIKWFADLIGNVVGFIVALFTGDWKEALLEAAEFFYDLFVKPIAKMVEGIIDLFLLIPQKFYEIIGAMLNKVAGALKHVPGLNKVSKGLSNIVNGIGDMIKNARSWDAESALDGLFDPTNAASKGKKKTKTEWDNIKKESYDAGKEGGAAYTEGTSDGLDPQEAYDKWKDFISTLRGTVEEQVNNAKDTAKRVFDQRVKEATKAFEEAQEKRRKAYDDQIKKIEDAQKADEKRYATEAYLQRKRELLTERQRNRENYMRDRALAVYEGRVNDVRTLDLEETRSKQDYSKSLKSIEEDRARELIQQRRDAAIEQIQIEKDKNDKIMEKEREAWDYMIQGWSDAFDRQLEEITENTPHTLAEYSTMLDQINALLESFGAPGGTFVDTGAAAVTAFSTAINEANEKIQTDYYWSGENAAMSWINGFTDGMGTFSPSYAAAPDAAGGAPAGGPTGGQPTGGTTSTGSRYTVDSAKKIKDAFFSAFQDAMAQMRSHGIAVSSKNAYQIMTKGGKNLWDNIQKFKAKPRILADYLTWKGLIRFFPGGTKVSTPLTIRAILSKLFGRDFTNTTHAPSLYHTGGLVRMHTGGLKTDEIPAILQRGEFVIRKSAVKKIGLQKLHNINKGISHKNLNAYMNSFKMPKSPGFNPKIPDERFQNGGEQRIYQQIDIHVDTFIGEKEWFNKMQNEYKQGFGAAYNRKIGTHNRKIATYKDNIVRY